jgi:uncharacterized phiE125 gp8 family phage protein
MLEGELAAPAVGLAEAQAYVRVETGEEEAVLAGLVRTASAMCEQFTGQVLLSRDFRETVRGRGEWQRLSRTPVRSIDMVEGIAADGTATLLPAGTYAVDIDSAGDGWVRMMQEPGEARLRVSGTAGMAVDGNGVPEPLRQGIVRLTAHLFNSRDGGSGDPPAAVTALWRPYRRLRLAAPPNPTVGGWRMS